MRTKIPRTREAEILFLNRHTCCVCHDKNKDVQIHHLDGNNSNNELGNLAVLCLDCHSQITGTRGLGKSYSPIEVKRYKQEWENIVRKKFGLPGIERAKKIPKIEKQLFVFEIKRLIYEMLSLKDSEKAVIDRNFYFLWNIALLEGLQKEIIEHLQFAFSLTAISQVNKPIALAHALPQFFNYLADPTDVKMEKSDEKNIIEAIETVEFLHNFSVEQNKNYRILSACKNCLSDFIQIAIRYKNRLIFSKAHKVLKEIKVSSESIYYKNDKKLPRLSKEIKDLLKDIRKEVKKAKLNWEVKV